MANRAVRDALPEEGRPGGHFFQATYLSFIILSEGEKSKAKPQCPESSGQNEFLTEANFASDLPSKNC